MSEIIEHDVEGYLNHLRVTHAESTIGVHKGVLNQFMKFYNKEYTPQRNYDNFLVEHKLRGHKKDSIRLYGSIIRCYYRYVGIPSDNLNLPRGQKRHRDALNERQQKELLEYLSDDYMFLVTQLLVNTGLRVSEACNLRWTDIDMNSRKLIVQHGKGDKKRTIPLNDTSMETLHELQHYKGEYVITSWRGKKTSPRALQYHYRSISEDLGFTVTPHILRHTFATNMIHKGLDVTVLQKIMGHTNLNTTQLYVHHDFNSIQEKFMEVQ